MDGVNHSHHYDRDPAGHLPSTLEPGRNALRMFDNITGNATTAAYATFLSRGTVYTSQTSPAYVRNFSGQSADSMDRLDRSSHQGDMRPRLPRQVVVFICPYTRIGRRSEDGGHGIQPCMPYIMETELGEQLFGDARYATCKKNKWECWRCPKEGLQRTANPGSACARCRAIPVKFGCSISTRHASTARTIDPVAHTRFEPVPNPPQYRISKPTKPAATLATSDRVLGALEAYRLPQPAQAGCSSPDDWLLHIPQDVRRLLNPRTLL